MFVYDVHSDGTLSTRTYAFRAPGEQIAVHPTAPFAFVTNHGPVDKNLSVYALDAVTGAPAEISGSPFQTGTEPHAIAFHPDGSFVFVTDIASGGIHGYTIDIDTGALTPAPGSPFARGESFHALAVR